MARKEPLEEEEEFQFVEEVPRVHGATNWMTLLLPLTTREGRGRWARVKIFDSGEHANWAQSNLSRRLVRIPDPEGQWEFAARNGELYAKYTAPSPKVAGRRVKPARPKPRRASK